MQPGASSVRSGPQGTLGVDLAPSRWIVECSPQRPFVVMSDAGKVGVARGALVERHGLARGSDGLLDDRFVQVVEDRAVRRRVGARARGGEEVLPGEALRRAGHLDEQGMGEVDLAAARRKLGAMAPRSV